MLTATIYWEKNRVKLIDQTKLPGKVVYLTCRSVDDIRKAIKTMRIRGAPAIGIAAGFGVVLGMKNFPSGADSRKFKRQFDKVSRYLLSARPTAVNLSWALKRMEKVAVSARDRDINTIKRLLLAEARRILAEDIKICRRIGKLGVKLIRPGSNVLTHCNAGGLATGGYGTALGVIKSAWAQGRKFGVYVDETRPVLQGARLTAWELMQAGIRCTLICDNMAAGLMRRGKIDTVIVGADRITAYGDTANKIGTYSIACLARMHRIPFYVAAPRSTFDLEILHGGDIPIEERDPEEVTGKGSARTAPAGVKVYNPAFDVTPGNLVTAFITEKGIIRPPYRKNIRVKFAPRYHK